MFFSLSLSLIRSGLAALTPSQGLEYNTQPLKYNGLFLTYTP